MPLSIAGRNAAVDGLATAATFLSLHSANPGDTGASEISGGSPAYARRPATWSAAVNGSRALSASAQFDVAAATTVSYFGSWSAASGGVFLGGDALRDTNGDPVIETFGGQGTYTLTTATLTVNNPAP